MNDCEQCGEHGVLCAHHHAAGLAGRLAYMQDEAARYRQERDDLRARLATPGCGDACPVALAERAAHLATRQELSAALADAAEAVRYWTDLAQAEATDAMNLRVEVERLTRERDEAVRACNAAQNHTEEAQGIARESMKRFDEMHSMLQTEKAEAARLREALRLTLHVLGYTQHDSRCSSGPAPYDRCVCHPWLQQARAALAGSEGPPQTQRKL